MAPLTVYDVLHDYAASRGWKVLFRFVDEYGRPIPNQHEIVDARRQFELVGPPGGLCVTEYSPGSVTVGGLDVFAELMLEQAGVPISELRCLYGWPPHEADGTPIDLNAFGL